MSKAEFENKSLVIIVFIAYTCNLLCGLFGSLSPVQSREQLLLFQLGAALAITGSVMAGRYTGIRGQHVAASAYILLGITHGISLAALSRMNINVERGLTMVMPMIPALVCMCWCTLYPRWLRVASVLPIVFFIMVYIKVQTGDAYFSWPLQAGYGILQITELLWGIYLWKDFKQQTT